MSPDEKAHVQQLHLGISPMPADRWREAISAAQVREIKAAVAPFPVLVDEMGNIVLRLYDGQNVLRITIDGIGANSLPTELWAVASKETETQAWEARQSTRAAALPASDDNTTHAQPETLSPMSDRFRQQSEASYRDWRHEMDRLRQQHDKRG